MLRTNIAYLGVVEPLAGAAGQRKLDRKVDWALSPRFTPGFG